MIGRSSVGIHGVAAAALVIGLGLASCSDLRGRPDTIATNPDEVVDFHILERQNCSGCHGPDGKGGAAIALGNPVFLAIASDSTIRAIASKGVRGTQMPAFARSEGGMLTDQQIDILIRGIRSRARAGSLQDASVPSYETTSPGDAQRGAEVFKRRCSSCHGPHGEGGELAGSIVNGSYLALVSDQHVRTVVITGRPELGMPDWRNNIPGHPMSEQEVSDVVAWLLTHRTQFPGQPYRVGSWRPAPSGAF